MRFFIVVCQGHLLVFNTPSIRDLREFFWLILLFFFQLIAREFRDDEDDFTDTLCSGAFPPGSRLIPYERSKFAR